MILGHSNISYIIPILFLDATLGSSLLPLTIECQDFVAALNCTAIHSTERSLLEKWYILDGKAEPKCYRLKTNDITVDSDIISEVKELFKNLVNIFSKELRDSYLTTVFEQEINNTVLINQELSKRCIWLQMGSPKSIDAGLTSEEHEINRRMNNVVSELKVIVCHDRTSCRCN